MTNNRFPVPRIEKKIFTLQRTKIIFDHTSTRRTFPVVTRASHGTSKIPQIKTNLNK